MSALSIDQAIADARGGGWPADLIPDAVGTALTESTLDPFANNGSHFGLFQFDDPTGQSVGYNHAQLFDPTDAFRAAYLLYQKRGWEPWAPNEPAATRAANIQKIRNYMKGSTVNSSNDIPVWGGVQHLAGQLGNEAGQLGNAAGQLGNEAGQLGNWNQQHAPDVQQGAKDIANKVDPMQLVSAAVSGVTGGMFELGRKALPFILIVIAIIGVGFALIEEMGK